MARKLRPEERELWKKVADTATPLAPPTKMEMPRALSVPKAEIKRPASVQPDLKAFKIGMKSRSIPPASRAQAAAKPAPVMDAKSFGKLRDIEENQVLKGRGLELAWVENPADIFFLQIQGSGRVRLQDGTTIRLGFGGSNGHRYQAIGPHLVELGVLQEHEVSANRIKQWVLDNPEKGQEIVWENPAYVFFRRVGDVPSDKGPLGAMNRSLTALRTLAVDPRYVTLGAPVWLEKGGSRPLNRLMIAQDTGSAITGPQRADVFFGTGSQAGIAAGLTKDSGRMILLLPIQEARARISGQ